MLQGDVRLSKPESSQNFTRHGSLRKVLPSDNGKENVFKKHEEDFDKLHRIFKQEYSILAEFKMIQTENLEGLYVIPSKGSPFYWFGVVFIRSGLYEDGIFRFTITLDDNFPDSGHPKVVFQESIYHPVIHSDTRELNLQGAFPTWNKKDNHLWHVCKYINWIFHNVMSSLPHAVNQETVQIFKNDQDAFKEKVKSCVQHSQDIIYDPPAETDKHYLCFERYNPEVHDSIRSNLLVPINEQNSGTSGHSWVLPGTFKSLSRIETPSESES